MERGHKMSKVIDGSPDVHPFDTPPDTQFFTKRYREMKNREQEELKALRKFMRDFDAWHTETRFPPELYNEQYHRMHTSWKEAESFRPSRAWHEFDTPTEYP